MQTTRSKDGTPLAFDVLGHGPPVVLALGAFNDRTTGGPLAGALADHFTVYAYDRRGRGDSGDRPPHAIEREVEDLDAILAASGPAAVVGYSSGAALALVAAASGLPIRRVALYELPPPIAAHHADDLSALVEAGRRGEAVEHFQRRIVGLPEPVVAQLRGAPFRPALEALAHTLVYDARLVAEGTLSASLLSRIRAPVLAVAGSSPVMRDRAAAVAAAVPDGRALALDGATHDLGPELAPVLGAFLAG